MSFETLRLVFGDPFHISVPDRHEHGEERWTTIAVIGSVVVLVVIHTSGEANGEETLRIIPARKATQRERYRYQADVGVDQGSDLIRSRKLTPAKVYESEVADELVLGDERSVYADKAYEKHSRRAALEARGIKDRIQHRRSRMQRELPHWQTVRNKLIGRVRSAVERTFSVLKGRYRLTRMRYRGLAANALHFDLIAIAYNLQRAASQPA